MVDSVSLEIFKNIFISIPEEMGLTLIRTSYSPNIKERRDLSCALFDGKGVMVAQAAHQPVHLGSMPTAVAAAIRRFTFKPGDMVIANDPFDGNSTHLPDITLISPVFAEKNGEEPFSFVVNRAHHTDVGGMVPGSLGLATEIFQEGIIIPPIKLIKEGVLDDDLLNFILRNVRTPDERRGDLNAQIAANKVGERRVHGIINRYGIIEIIEHMQAILDYSERMVRSAISKIPDGKYVFKDYIDDDGNSPDPIPIIVEVNVEGDELIANFTGSSPQRQASVNAVLPVTISALLYVMSCIAGEHIPCNSGSLVPLKVIAPSSSVVNASWPAAVVAANGLTSMRIVDVLFGALAQALPNIIPAASQGTLNGMGIGGYDPFRKQFYTYVETMAGGMGARAGLDGLSAVHTHMANTLNTPIEALELQFPFRIHEYSIRKSSGGAGRYRGGNGLIRRYYFLAPATVTFRSDRKKFPPYGLNGGMSGAPSRQILRKKDSTEVELSSKFTMGVDEGDEFTVETPGGGGWGTPEQDPINKGQKKV